ncbi:MAG: lipid A biosynthesis lauroyl acyltransferase [Gammaproteobacteria bacterium]|nr:lipid A biosynthesis lauroyl acyltransferase [Gammaproteobacteria bacterium]
MKNTPLKKLIFNPLYWPTAFFLAVLRLLVLLPVSWLEYLGTALGMLVYYARPSRARAAMVNLKIAFPEHTAQEITRLCKTNFKHLGTGVFEVGLAWWQQKKLLKISRINGLHHLTAALEKGRGVILLTSHFTCLEIGAHIICTKVPLEAVYKPAKNKLFDFFMVKKRNEHFSKLISNDSPRKIIAALKRNHVIWYAPDQNLRGKDVVFAPFFNEMATAITAPSRLATLSGAALVPYYIKRHRDKASGEIIYELFILPCVENFPTDDINKDAAQINLINEDLIRQNPEQYLWVHKRYKTRPPGEKPLY